MKLPQFVTRGSIAEKLDEPVQRVGHILATRRHIAPITKIGAAFLYDRGAIRLVRIEIEQMEARRSKSVPA